MAEANAAAPYLTGQNPTSTALAASSTTNPAQIWSFMPKGEGYSPVAQNYGLGRLPSAAGASIGMGKNGSGDAGKYYVAELRPGVYQLATTQTGGIAYSAATAGRSESYGSDNACYQLEPVSTITVSMQSSGLKGICYSFDILIPEDLEVYVLDHIDGQTACMLRVYDRLPAGEPAIIRGQSYQSIPLQIAAPTESNIAPNLLRGTYYAESGIKGALYTLKTTDGGIFGKSAIGNVPANSVYLLMDTAADSKFTLDFSDEPCKTLDRIPIVPARASASAIYDLQGNKVHSPLKGHIYIQGRNKIKTR